MASKVVNTRIQLKSDTEANWLKAGPKDGGRGFVPLLGELIVYIPDDTHPFSRLKVGDGKTNVVDLPFATDAIITATNKYSFPPIGQENKLYIDLEKKAIYGYKPTSGFTQLSHFRYTANKTQISTVDGWDPGTMTIAWVDDNSLVIDNGTIPTLDLGTLNVVTDISEVNE